MELDIGRVERLTIDDPEGFRPAAEDEIMNEPLLALSSS